MGSFRSKFIGFSAAALLVLGQSCQEAPEAFSIKKAKPGTTGSDDQTGKDPGPGTDFIPEVGGEQPIDPNYEPEEKELFDRSGKSLINSFDPSSQEKEGTQCEPSGPEDAAFAQSCMAMGYKMIPYDFCLTACTGNVLDPVLSPKSSIPESMVGKKVYNEKWKETTYKLFDEQMLCDEIRDTKKAFTDECAKGGFNVLATGACELACTGLPSTVDIWKDTVSDPGTQGDGDFTIGPNYSDAADGKEKAGVPKGTLREFSMNSKDSKIFKGQDDFLKFKGDFTRKGWLYTPPGYKNDKELPFMVVGDGSWNQHKVLLINSLNNLIAAKKIPPMAAILISPGVINGKGDGPGSQRSFEYDSVTPAFGDFIETEVIPKVVKQFGVKLTSNPEGRATMGGSSSGAMAFGMAWFKPDKYRRVLTYSGTFVNRIQTEEHPKGAWEYHQKMLPMSEKKPLRIYIHVSENDNNFNNGDNDWIKANNAMAKVFKEKGYHYRFHYAKNAGHCDGKVYRQTLPENLVWLWRGYPIP